MFSTTFVVVAALSAIASAQNYSTSGPLSIDASQIAPALRQSWCLGQTNNCPLVCGGTASPNTCDQNTLQWTCTCTDGSQPNITNYAAMMPSYICAQWRANCVDNHQGDAAGIFACQSVTCGSANASAVAANNSASSSSSSAVSSATASATSSGSQTSSASASASATAKGAAAALNVATSYGTGVLAAGLLAAFGLAL